MDPSPDPRPAATEPTASRNILHDDAVVAYLRTRAPGLPTARLDPRAVTSRARRALRRRRRNSALALVTAATVYLALALAGPLPAPGLGAVSVPGGNALRVLVLGPFPGGAARPDQRHADVDRLETDVLPVVEELRISYYFLEPGPCRVLDYARGNYRDGDPECNEVVPFDAQARADFDKVTGAVKRSGVAVERIVRSGDGIHVQLEDNSWQYNWEYAYLPDTGSPPVATSPDEQWTHIRGDWWFHRTHDD